MRTNCVLNFFETHPNLTTSLEIGYSCGLAQIVGLIAIPVLFAQNKYAEHKLKQLCNQDTSMQGQKNGRYYQRLIEKNKDYIGLIACTMVPVVGTILLHKIFSIAMAKFNLSKLN